jgi:hypothetical protein
MKKNLLAVVALVLALTFSAFTPKFNLRYIVYDGAGAENNFSNYSVQTTSPGTSATSTTIWWFRVNDGNGTVTQAEFDGTYFPAADTDGDDFLSDEAEGATLEKKTF